MLRTKSLVSSINEVPREWVFEHYLELAEKLTGQDVRMKSVFNPNDKKPSFFVYYARHKKKYLFKDFSTDDQGDGTELVKVMFNLTSRGEAAHMIIDAYNKFKLTNPGDHSKGMFLLREKYKVSSFGMRNWTQVDQSYWTKFKIGSKLLNFYKVKPLESYTMSKTENGRTKELTMSGNRMYGYFKADGTLYKIYQPMSKENKFIKVVNYIQGLEQLQGKKYLVICSSLKDMMAFAKLGMTNAETIAPDSENIIIPKEIMDGLRAKYKYEGICTLFDNDPAGTKSMAKYEEEHQLPYVHFKLEKDLADAVKAHGINTTRIHLYPLLTKALTGKAKQI